MVYLKTSLVHLQMDQQSHPPVSPAKKKVLIKGHEQLKGRRPEGISPSPIFTCCLSISSQIPCPLRENYQSEKSCFLPPVPQTEKMAPRLFMPVIQLERYCNIAGSGQTTLLTFDISDHYSVEFATLSPSADNYPLKILFKKTFERTLFYSLKVQHAELLDTKNNIANAASMQVFAQGHSSFLPTSVFPGFQEFILFSWCIY